MTQGLLPQRLVHRGTVTASGLLISTDPLGVTEARRRVLSLWKPGTTVHDVGDAYVVVFPGPRPLRVVHTPGTPLVATEGVLSGCPLTPDEAAAVGAPPGSVVIPRGGVLRALPRGNAVDPSDWLSVSDWPLVSVRTLGAEPAPPALVVEPAPFDARTKLEGVPEASAQMTQVAAALTDAMRTQRSTPTTSSLGAGLFSRLGMAWRSFWRNLTGQTPPPSTTPAKYAPAPVPPWLMRLRAALDKALAELLMATQLSRLIGRQHAEYLMRMMDMLERGDVREALRHAIPLANSNEDGTARPALGPMAPRENLDIHPWSAPGGARGVGLGPDLYAELQRRYRALLERLEMQGRIDEAAFVLAELLRAHEEAVGFLERHGRLKLAAELAEARGLPPGLVIRQWFLAGDHERALRLVQQSGEFADAIRRLERTHPDEAKRLRVQWADRLAEAGNLAAAVEVISSLRDEQERAVRWMDQLILAGGPTGARMLIRKLTLVPDAFPDIRARVTRLLDDDGPELAPVRLALAEALSRTVPTPGVRPLARAATRAIIRDSSLPDVSWAAPELRRLVTVSGDAALMADIPSVTPRPRAPLAERATPLELTWEAQDAGTVPAHDVAWLPDGRVLVALGDAGARVFSPHGRVQAQLEEPAVALVTSSEGTRAIAVARRGELCRLARLDLVALRVESWCDARLDAWADAFDGLRWFTASKGAVSVVDPSAPRLLALWRVSDVGRVTSLSADDRRCSFSTDSPHGGIIWTYALAQMRLTQRRQMDSPSFTAGRVVSSEGWVAEVIPQKDAQMLGISFEDNKSYAVMLPREPIIAGLTCGTRWLALWYLHDGAVHVELRDIPLGQLRARLTLQGARRVNLRLQPRALCVGDDRGRALVLELGQGRIIADWRV
ncbi:MAG: bpX6 domain-containing protein [Myxococcota bacterium]